MHQMIGLHDSSSWARRGFYSTSRLVLSIAFCVKPEMRSQSIEKRKESVIEQGLPAGGAEISSDIYSFQSILEHFSWIADPFFKTLRSRKY